MIFPFQTDDIRATEKGFLGCKPAKRLSFLKKMYIHIKGTKDLQLEFAQGNLCKKGSRKKVPFPSGTGEKESVLKDLLLILAAKA